MKKVIFIILVIFIFTLYNESKTNNVNTISEPKFISLYHVAEDKIIYISYKDYIINIVSQEISQDYNLEAIKAQTVAVRSFVLYNLYSNNKSNTIDFHEGAVLCNSKHCIEWDCKKKKEIDKKFYTAYEETKGEYISYNNSSTIALWHKISHGKTENSFDILEVDYPYHKTVISEFDKKAPGYISRAIYSADAFCTIISGLSGKKIDSDIISEKTFGEASRTPNGCVKTIQISNETYTGQEIKDAFKLKNTFFNIEVCDSNIIFNVRGDGHNVGMSQFGANAMAENGSKYTDIICYYFPGAIISSLNHIA